MITRCQYEKRFEKDDREKDRRKAREAMSDKIRMKMEFRQQVGDAVSCLWEGGGKAMMLASQCFLSRYQLRCGALAPEF